VETIAAMAKRLVVFTRYPEPGRTKTRLIGHLGADGAAELQREMGMQVLSAARAFGRGSQADIEVCFDGGSPLMMRHWLGFDLGYRRQGRGDLGVRMRRAFRRALGAAECAVIIGTDCPSVTAKDLADAFNALRTSDLVLGPAEDGGYYLIGLRRQMPEADAAALFRNMHWGMATVFDETVSRARKLGREPAILRKLRDIDRREDVGHWQDLQEQRSARPEPLISVVIPTLTEEENLAAMLGRLNGVPNSEVIICDGGRADWRADMADAGNVRIVRSKPCRARQMNDGAASADGEIVLFLHADTRLPRGFERHVRYALDLPGVAAGAFALGIDGPGWGLRLIERLANWRSRRLQMPYGDQGLFLKASVFRGEGGFPEFPIMEDFEFVRRLKKRGRIMVSPAVALTCARRWKRLGILRTTLLNQLIILCYYLGVSPGRLARWYRSERLR
jgi:rSAM/selenodomain-associated transferase 2/rSAM/selenodomain-associated transferase 1